MPLEVFTDGMKTPVAVVETFIAEWKNRSWQRMHRHGTMRKRLSIHSDIPCLLERRMSREPHLRQTNGPLMHRILRYPLKQCCRAGEFEANLSKMCFSNVAIFVL